MTNSLAPTFIEAIHDVLVGVFLPFDEEVKPTEYRNRAYIEASAARPFHTVGGVEVWPTLAEKAASLFHALACNHCFFNGNKRTAVIALDLFLIINGTLLTLTPDQVYQMAIQTTEANMNRIPLETVMASLAKTIGEASIMAQDFDSPGFMDKFDAAGRQRIKAYIARTTRFALKLITHHSPETDSNKIKAFEKQLLEWTENPRF